jgi:hypothetical protein
MKTKRKYKAALKKINKKYSKTLQRLASSSQSQVKKVPVGSMDITLQAL